MGPHPRLGVRRRRGKKPAEQPGHEDVPQPTSRGHRIDRRPRAHHEVRPAGAAADEGRNIDRPVLAIRVKRDQDVEPIPGHRESEGLEEGHPLPPVFRESQKRQAIPKLRREPIEKRSRAVIGAVVDDDDVIDQARRLPHHGLAKPGDVEARDDRGDAVKVSMVEFIPTEAEIAAGEPFSVMRLLFNGQR